MPLRGFVFGQGFRSGLSPGIFYIDSDVIMGGDVYAYYDKKSVWIKLLGLSYTL